MSIQTISICNRCGRIMTDPVSIRARYGPICLAKINRRETGDRESPDAAPKLPWDPKTMDVICRRHPDPHRFTDKEFNIPHAVIRHSPTGMEWGYLGSGPADFALNILYAFTHDERFSQCWHQEFKEDFVARIPREGGTIPGGIMKAWIARKRTIEHSQLGLEDMG